jgi:hypothetical protein
MRLRYPLCLVPLLAGPELSFEGRSEVQVKIENLDFALPRSLVARLRGREGTNV